MQPRHVKGVPMPRSRTPIRAHGYRQAGTKLYPSAWKSAAMRPDGRWQAGTRKHPLASRGHPWALMVTRKLGEGCIARGKACGPRVRSIPGNDGKVHRFAGRARPCALIDARIKPEGPSNPRRRTLPLVLFDTVIDGRAALDRPDGRLASRGERRVRHEARPLSGEMGAARSPTTCPSSA